MKMKIVGKYIKKEKIEQLVKFFNLDEFEYDREIRKDKYYLYSHSRSHSESDSKADFCIEVDDEVLKHDDLDDLFSKLSDSNFVVFFTFKTKKTAKEMASISDSIQFINVEKNQIRAKKKFGGFNTQILLNSQILKIKVSDISSGSYSYSKAIQKFRNKNIDGNKEIINDHTIRFYYHKGEKSLKSYFLNNCLKAVVQDNLKCMIDKNSKIEIFDDDLIFEITKFSRYVDNHEKYLEYRIRAQNLKKEYALFKFLRRINKEVKFEREVHNVSVDERFSEFEFSDNNILEKKFDDITAVVDVKENKLFLITKCELRYKTIQDYMRKIDELENKILRK